MNDLLELQEKANATAVAAILDQPVATYTDTNPIPIGQAISAIWSKQIAFYNQGPAFTTELTLHLDDDLSKKVADDEDDVRARELKSRLAALGNDGRAVAGSLRKQGITGHQGSASSCAVAQWVKKNFEAYGAVSVGGAVILLQAPDGTSLRVLTPQPVRDFIRMFDAGAFPEMEIENPYRYRIQSTDFFEYMGMNSVTVSGPLPKFVPSL